MYYKRFTKKDLDVAIANEVISMEQVGIISYFYEKDIFILRGRDNVDKLKTVIPNVIQEKSDVEQNLFFMQVVTWPYLKLMCLKFAPRKPCRWIYVAENPDTLLFEYRIDDYSIVLP
jgi:hypothetical protein